MPFDGAGKVGAAVDVAAGVLEVLERVTRVVGVTEEAAAALLTGGAEIEEEEPEEAPPDQTDGPGRS